jgi:MFS family permease
MNKLNKRFLPLYTSTFFSGLVFWYAIEKLFMAQIGFTDATIILAIALSTACILLFEIPSGILADKWSRRGVLILAQVSLGLSSFVGYLSHGPLLFLLSVGLWGVYSAMSSGAAESIVYDTLLEENGDRHGFEKYYGRTRTFISISLVAGSLLGGVISEFFDPRAAFLLTVPSAVLGIVAILFLHEPTLHKTETDISIKQHIRNSAKLFKSSELIITLTLSVVLLNTVYRFLFEFYQLWLVALGLGVVYYGAVNALLNTSFGIAGYFTHIVQKRGFNAYILGIASALSLLGLLSKSLPVVITSIVVVIILLSMINVMLAGKLHDQISSSQRSGISSTVSTIGTILFLAISLPSSYLVHYSIYWSIPILLALTLAGTYYAKKIS